MKLMVKKFRNASKAGHEKFGCTKGVVGLNKVISEVGLGLNEVVRK